MPPRKRPYIKNVFIGIDQLANTLFSGYPDETLSSRAYRGAKLAANPKRKWRLAYRLINALFFWQDDHCQAAYLSEVNREQYPGQFRTGKKPPSTEQGRK